MFRQNQPWVIQAGSGGFGFMCPGTFGREQTENWENFMSRIHLLTSLVAVTVYLPVSAQTSKALISGIVTDGSGAAIRNAKVTITDVQIGRAHV